jgi:hypothetical protein
MLLAAYACGNRSRALHAFALTADFGDAYLEDVKHEVAEEEERDLEAGANGITHERLPPTRLSPRRKTRERIPSPDALRTWPTPRAGDFERVLLFAGESGATFTLGVLDELVGRWVRLGRRDGEKTRRVV